MSSVPHAAGLESAHISLPTLADGVATWMQVLASLRVEQGRPQEALAALHKSMGLWYTPHPESSAGREAAGKAPPSPAEQPSYEFRLEAVKLLLELEDTIETAAEVRPPGAGLDFSDATVGQILQPCIPSRDAPRRVARGLPLLAVTATPWQHEHQCLDCARKLALKTEVVSVPPVSFQ